MELTPYLQNVQRLFQERVLAVRFEGEATLSLPVSAHRPGTAGKKDALADAVFVYRDVSGKGRPYAWGMLDAATGEPLIYARCEAHDFMPAALFPPDMPLALHTPHPLGEATRNDARRELLTVYERVRRFALTENLNREQSGLRERLARLFEMLAYREHRPFYRALSPQFIGWLGFSEAEWPAPGAAASGDNVAAALRELSDLFARKIETDAHKERLFDELHAELREYRKDLLESFTRPMEGDVIKLIDDIEKSMEAFRSRQFTPDNYRRLLTLFEGVGTDLGDLLYRHGLEPFSQEGDEVAVGRQKILATLPTDKPKLDKKVAVRHSRGWEKNGKVVRPERVSVYMYEKDAIEN